MTRMTTSNEDRARIVAAYLEGSNAKAISSVLRLKRGAVYAVLSVYKKENRVESKVRGRPRARILTDIQKLQIKQWVDEDASISLTRLKQKCMESFDVTISERSIGRCLDVFHYTMKRIALLPARRNTENALQSRAAFSSSFMQLLASTEHNRIYYLDEAGFSVSMRARRGRSMRGTRAVQVVSSIRTRNLSLLCAMNKQGIVYYFVQERAFNTNTFLTALGELFVQFNVQNITNAMLILDNVPFHRAQQVRDLVESNGHRLMFLPPYSPFLNPIENMFSKWKEGVRRERPENEEQLLQKIHSGATLISSEDCDSYFRHMIGFIARCLNMEEIINENI